MRVISMTHFRFRYLVEVSKGHQVWVLQFSYVIIKLQDHKSTKSGKFRHQGAMISKSFVIFTHIFLL